MITRQIISMFSHCLPTATARKDFFFQSTIHFLPAIHLNIIICVPMLSPPPPLFPPFIKNINGRLAFILMAKKDHLSSIGRTIFFNQPGEQTSFQLSYCSLCWQSFVSSKTWLDVPKLLCVKIEWSQSYFQNSLVLASEGRYVNSSIRIFRV